MAETLPSIEWRVHFRAAPEAVWDAWTTDAGRESFWAEKSQKTEDGLTLDFIHGQTLSLRVFEAVKPSRFVFSYFGSSRVTLELSGDERGGSDLRLIEEGVAADEHLENYAGWISVLLGCKAAVDFAVDLRSHDASRTWNDRSSTCSQRSPGGCWETSRLSWYRQRRRIWGLR